MARKLLTSKEVLGMAVGKTPADLRYDKNKDGKITSADALAYSKTAKAKIAQKREDRAVAASQKAAATREKQAQKQMEMQRARAASATPKQAAPKAAPTGPTQYGSMRTPAAPPPRGRFAKGGVAKKKVATKKGKK